MRRRTRPDHDPLVSSPVGGAVTQERTAATTRRDAGARPSDVSVAPSGTRLGERLVQAGLASPDQISDALTRLQAGSHSRLGQLLVEQGVISEHVLAHWLADQHGLRTVDLRLVAPETGATALLAEDAARALLALPLGTSDDGIVTVAVADPTPGALARVRAALDRPMQAVVAAPSDLARALDNSYRALSPSRVNSQVTAFEAKHKARAVSAQPELATANEEAPVVQVVQLVIAQAVRDRASDVHIQPQGDRLRVRYRVDGALLDVLSLPGAMGPGIVSRIKILAGMNIVETRRPQDGQMSTAAEGREVDIRVSTTTAVGGEKVVMRLLDKSRPLFALQDIGMPTDMVHRYRSLVEAPFGMVICAGPTGSGKTTTLYGALHEVNTPERNIVTIEDPVEYTFPDLTQIQVNEAAGMTFATGLRSVLRQDPDMILVGEMRDIETARIAVQAALTGHFVMSSLHAVDSVSALHRLLDMGVEPFLVASSLTAVVAQRLVRKVCGRCVESHPISAEEIAFLRAMDVEPPAEVVRGAGCNFCAGTGYLERIGVYEMLEVTEPIRELVLARASQDEMRKVAVAEGMRTLQEQAVQLVMDGVTNIAEIVRCVFGAATSH